MSRYITRTNGTDIEDIENMEICKWRINDVCCNEESKYVADYPPYWCKCDSIMDCECYEEEDGEYISDYYEDEDGEYYE